jgi:hypothetical protein
VSAALRPVPWRRLVCAFERDGFTFKKRAGRGTSHWIGTKSGVPRPLVIPEYPEVGLDIIHSNLRTAQMSRDRLLELLRDC